MSWNIFKQKENKLSDILPCSKKPCPYEYGMGSDRDMEGMPFPKAKNDPRRCPHYGHICPEFMEEVNLSVDDLMTRATLHCGVTLQEMIAQGKVSMKEAEADEAMSGLMKRYDKVLEDYPQKDYPRFYIWEV